MGNKIEEIATKLMSGILSNPNYNFENVKKAADIAMAHAKALAEKLEEGAKEVANKTATAVEKTAEVVEKKAEQVKEAAASVKEKTKK